MDYQDQHSYRRAAAEAFFDSLDQLQEALEVPDFPCANFEPPSEIEEAEKARSGKTFSLAELEQAVADIEEFFQAQQLESEDFKD